MWRMMSSLTWTPELSQGGWDPHTLTGKEMNSVDVVSWFKLKCLACKYFSTETCFSFCLLSFRRVIHIYMIPDCSDVDMIHDDSLIYLLRPHARQRLDLTYRAFLLLCVCVCVCPSSLQSPCCVCFLPPVWFFVARALAWLVRSQLVH